jgi:hypothetical protein
MVIFELTATVIFQLLCSAGDSYGIALASFTLLDLDIIICFQINT